jgi:hypothetical protein
MPRRRIRQPRRTATRAERLRAALLIGAGVIAGAVILAVDFGADGSVVPEVASWIDPGNSDALTGMAGSLAADDLDVANGYARRAIAHNPLEDRALVVAALAATSVNQIARADALFEHITKLTRREPLAETWMFDVAAARGHYAEALDHADAALRRRTGADIEVMPVLIAITNASPALPAFAHKLAGNPPWRAAFFRAFVRSKTGDSLALYDALRRSGDRPTPIEVAAMASQQIAAGNLPKARAVWQKGFGHPLPTLLSPNFESVMQYGDFGWAIVNRGGVQVVARLGGQGHAVEVEPSQTGKRITRVLQQAMLLDSGRHAISFEGRSVAGGAPVASVAVLCAGDNLELARAAVPNGQAWATMRFVFGVPAQDCPIQKLVIDAVPNVTQDTTPALIDNFRVE